MPLLLQLPGVAECPGEQCGVMQMCKKYSEKVFLVALRDDKVFNVKLRFFLAVWPASLTVVLDLLQAPFLLALSEH